MQFIGVAEALHERVQEAVRFLGVEERDEVIEVYKLPIDSADCISISKGEVNRIGYRRIHHLFRAISLFVQLSNQCTDTFCHKEKDYFSQCGPMIDCSRNAVYTVDTVKETLLKIALMGHNQCMLYTEDTYTLEEYPYFGYLRGRYTHSELRELDDYADSLGIEMVPCIQALAHLNQTFRWDYIQPMIDIDDILLVGEEKTYTFIEVMLKNLRSIFRSNQIHIGMDEAYALGRGKYLDHNGHKHHFDIMIAHLNRVVEIAKKYAFTPMVWDDMFQRTHEDGYDTQLMISPSIAAQVPEGLSLVYWDYYQQDPARYQFALEARKVFKNPIVFAGGIWKWGGLVPNYEKTMATTNAALQVCKEYGIQQVIATLWGDDGDEVPLRTGDLGLVLFAEHRYNKDVDPMWLEERCMAITGLSVADFMQMEKIDLLPMIERPNYDTVNPSKTFLYQDILLGAFDQHAQGLLLQEHYASCIETYENLAKKNGAYSYIYTLYRNLSKVLLYKYDLGVRLRTSYLAGDKATLKQLVEEVFPLLKEALMEYTDSFRHAWFVESKGHGFDIIDIRLGGIMARLQTATLRIEQYVAGEIRCIEELADDRLPFARRGNKQFGNQNQYVHIASPNVFSHNFITL